MRLITRSTLEPASQIPRVIRRLGSEFTNPLTPATPGRILRQIRVFPPGQVLIALAPLVSGAFGLHPRIADRLSMAVRSPLSSLIQATRILSTFHPIGACAASARRPEALPRSLLVFLLMGCGNPLTAGQRLRC